MLALFQQVQPQSSASWLGIPGEHLTLVLMLGVPILSILLIGVIAIVLDYLKKVRIAEAETRLKEAMIAQGRPTEEIERVIRATAHGKKPGD